MANDTKRIGKKYRILTNAATRAWDVISFWTSSHDVEMDDGTNLQDSLDSVKEQGDASAEIVEGLKATVTGAKVYDSTRVYSKGDFVNYNGTIYYCNTDITTPESWNSSHWTVVDGTIPFNFGIDSDGNYGYIKVGADSVTPFRSAAIYKIATNVTSGQLDIRSMCNNNGINYSKLTSSNFMLQVVGASGGISDGWAGSNSGGGATRRDNIRYSLSYESSSGILTYDSGQYFVGGFGSGGDGVIFHEAASMVLNGDYKYKSNGNWVQHSGGINPTNGYLISATAKFIPKIDIYLIVSQGDIIDLTQTS